MRNILIRDVDDYTACRLSEMAKKKGVSRTSFLREQLELLAEYPDLMERDSKYEELFNRIMDVQEKTLLAFVENENIMYSAKKILTKSNKRIEKRKRVHLEEEVSNELKNIAIEKDISFPEVVQHAIDFYLKYRYMEE